MYMCQIILKDKSEIAYVRNRFPWYQLNSQITDNQTGKIITIIPDKHKGSTQALGMLLLELWIVQSKKETIMEIIKQYYYYEDQQEINHILEVLYERLLTKEPLGQASSEVREELLQLLISELDTPAPFDFDACIAHHDKHFQLLMISEVGYAIDECKQEEQYQHFIQSLREYIKNQPDKTRILHIVQGEPFTFYNEKGHRYTAEELQFHIQKEPIYIVGLDEDELNITPIITLLPTYIYIYGQDPNDAKTTAVQTIFQERVAFKSLQSFPFTPIN